MEGYFVTIAMLLIGEYKSQIERLVDCNPPFPILGRIIEDVLEGAKRIPE